MAKLSKTRHFIPVIIIPSKVNKYEFQELDCLMQLIETIDLPCSEDA